MTREYITMVGVRGAAVAWLTYLSWSLLSSSTASMTSVQSFVAIVVAVVVAGEEDLSSLTLASPRVPLSVDRREVLKEDCNVEELKELFLARSVTPTVGAPDKDEEGDDVEGCDCGGEVIEWVRLSSAGLPPPPLAVVVAFSEDADEEDDTTPAPVPPPVPVPVPEAEAEGGDNELEDPPNVTPCTCPCCPSCPKD